VADRTRLHELARIVDVVNHSHVDGGSLVTLASVSQKRYLVLTVSVSVTDVTFSHSDLRQKRSARSCKSWSDQQSVK